MLLERLVSSVPYLIAALMTLGVGVSVESHVRLAAMEWAQHIRLYLGW